MGVVHDTDVVHRQNLSDSSISNVVLDHNFIESII